MCDGQQGVSGMRVGYEVSSGPGGAGGGAGGW